MLAKHAVKRTGLIAVQRERSVVDKDAIDEESRAVHVLVRADRHVDGFSVTTLCLGARLARAVETARDDRILVRLCLSLDPTHCLDFLFW